jgi:hypothetical protein
MPTYPIHSNEELNEFLESYIPLVLAAAKKFDIDLKDDRFSGDHLGFQVMSGNEFDIYHQIILKNSKMIKDSVIHERRNRIYRFKDYLQADGIVVPRIEMFEPKPNADLADLRPGIEHISFTVEAYDDFLQECQKRGVPIDKVVDMKGSKFFKTKLIDNIEIEFRNDELGE